MRERDMRGRVEAFLMRRLRAMVTSPALGVGLALTTSCKAHLPESRPCTVHDFEDEANTPCVGSRPEGVAIYSATAPPDYQAAPPYDGPDGEDHSPAPLGPPPNLFKPRPEGAAREIAASIERCDLPALRAAVLSHEELSAISQSPPGATTYEQTVTLWLATWSSTDCGPAQPPTAPRQPTIKSVVNVPAGPDWKVPLALVSVTLPVRISETPPSQITMVALDGRWRILLR